MKEELAKIDVLELYEFVRDEMASNELDEELWLKALAQSGQIEAVARDKYKSMRVRQLKIGLSLEGKKRGQVEAIDVKDDQLQKEQKPASKQGLWHLLCVSLFGVLIPMFLMGSLVWYHFFDEKSIEEQFVELQRASVNMDAQQEVARQSVLPEIDAETLPAGIQTEVVQPDETISSVADEQGGSIESASMTDKAQTWSLRVVPDPADALVRIVNIKPPYHEGMRLPEGAYHLKVSKDGYVSEDIWLNLRQDMVHRIGLRPIEIVPKRSWQSERSSSPITHISVYALKFAEATAECEMRSMRLPTPKELEEAIHTGRIAGHEGEWFWTSGRDDIVHYQVIQNDEAAKRRSGDLSHRHAVYCVQ